MEMQYSGWDKRYTPCEQTCKNKEGEQEKLCWTDVQSISKKAEPWLQANPRYSRKKVRSWKIEDESKKRRNSLTLAGLNTWSKLSRKMNIKYKKTFGQDLFWRMQLFPLLQLWFIDSRSKNSLNNFKKNPPERAKAEFELEFEKQTSNYISQKWTFKQKASRRTAGSNKQQHCWIQKN